MKLKALAFLSCTAVALGGGLSSEELGREESSKVPRKLYVFGDSYSDDGNRQALVLGQSTAAPWWRGRFSDGPMWNEYTAKLLDLLLENHAYANATSDNKFVPSTPGGGEHQLPSVRDQIDSFFALNAFWKSSNYISDSYAVIEIGSNDIIRTFDRLANGTVAVDQFSDTLSSIIYDHLDRLRNFGFTKFLVFTPIAYDLAPAVNTRDNDVQMYRKVAGAYEAELAQSVERLRKQTGVKWAHVFDMDKFMHITAGHNVSTKLGITNTKDAAWTVTNLVHTSDKGIPDDPAVSVLFSREEGNLSMNQYNFFFFDVLHIGAKVHRAMGYTVAEAIKAAEDGRDYLLDESSILNVISKNNLGGNIELPTN